MKLVYTHENRLLVSNAHNLLEQAGIECVWKNEFAASAIGELAPISSWPELWVVNDAHSERAAALIETAFSSSSLPQWICSQCQEMNEPAFDYCWRCQTEKPESAS